MKHTRQEQLKAHRLAIAESVIKKALLEGKVKEAVNYARINNISPERFGELVKMVDGN